MTTKTSMVWICDLCSHTMLGDVIPKGWLAVCVTERDAYNGTVKHLCTECVRRTVQSIDTEMHAMLEKEKVKNGADAT